MRLICVENRINKSDLVDFDNYKKYYYNLTIYKSYEVDGIVNKELVKLNDDLGHVRFFPKDCFKTLDEIRDEKINIILYGK